MTAVKTDVHVEGLKEAIRALGKIDRQAAGELRKELRTKIGGAFVRDVKLRVELRGLVGKSGRLRNSIRPTVRGASLVVRSSPALKPGPKSRQGYAAVYEFGRGGRRSFLEPTLGNWLETGRLRHEMGDYLDWIGSEFRS
jgi:hypothetical protein